MTVETVWILASNLKCWRQLLTILTENCTKKKLNWNLCKTLCGCNIRFFSAAHHVIYFMIIVSDKRNVFQWIRVASKMIWIILLRFHTSKSGDVIWNWNGFPVKMGKIQSKIVICRTFQFLRLQRLVVFYAVKYSVLHLSSS